MCKYIIRENRTIRSISGDHYEQNAHDPACRRCQQHTPETLTAGKVAGFSLHAGVAAKANQRDKLERLCRYITCPAISEKRLSLTNQGKVRYELKTASNNKGQTTILRLRCLKNLSPIIYNGSRVKKSSHGTASRASRRTERGSRIAG